MPGPRAPEEARREQILTAAYRVATRTGLDGVTLRAVAADARLSHGLVVFYFDRKDQLIDALLDRVLAAVARPHPVEALAAMPHAADRLRALLQQELERLAREPEAFRLFLEFWALGTREPTVRARIADAVERYRSRLRDVAAEMLREEPADANTAVTPEGVAAVLVSLISGFALQAMIEAEAFDGAAYVAAVRRLLDQPAGTDAGVARRLPSERRTR